MSEFENPSIVATAITAAIDDTRSVIDANQTATGTGIVTATAIAIAIGIVDGMKTRTRGITEIGEIHIIVIGEATMTTTANVGIAETGIEIGIDGATGMQKATGLPKAIDMPKATSVQRERKLVATRGMEIATPELRVRNEHSRKAHVSLICTHLDICRI